MLNKLVMHFVSRLQQLSHRKNHAFEGCVASSRMLPFAQALLCGREESSSGVEEEALQYRIQQLRASANR
jgi:hypothetical protein